MVKRRWGPAAWITLHAAAAAADEDNMDYFCSLVIALSYTMPCPECRKHAKSFIERVPISEVRSQVDAVSYVYRLHNEVNVRLGKSEEPPGLPEALFGVRPTGNERPCSFACAVSRRRGSYAKFS